MKKTILCCFMLTLMPFTWGSKLQLVPAPRQLEYSGGKVYLPKTISIWAPHGYKTEAAQLSEVIEQASLKIKPQAMFTFKLVSRQEQKSTGITQQSYSINVTDKSCTITAENAIGIFYGIQTLKQLLQRDDKGIFIYKLKIKDSPALEMRGVFLNFNIITANQKSIKSIKNLFAAMAALKINTLFLEFSDNIKYVSRSLPKKKATAFTPEQVKDLVKYAKSLHMEVIPCLQTLSHCVWILSNPNNVKFLENPKDKSWAATWCPNNIEVQAFIKDIVKETIDIFKPNYFHIGADEVSWGAYRYCDVCKKQAVSYPLKKHILFMHSLLKENNVKTIIYHDEFLRSHYDGSKAGNPLSKTNGWEIINQLPKDIIISPWIYSVDDKKTLNSELEFFSNKGFKVIGASFNDASSTKAMAEVLSTHPNALGMFMTYWFLIINWTNEVISPQAMSITTLLGTYAWNPTDPPLEKIKYDTVYAMSRNWFNKNTLSPSLPQNSLAIPYNCQLGLNWPFLPDGDVIKPIPPQLNVKPAAFKMGPQSGNNVLAVSGNSDDGLLVSEASFPVNLLAEKLNFLHACEIPANLVVLETLFGLANTPTIGEYIIKYDDNTKTVIPLQFRKNITSWNSRLSPLHGKYAYSDATKQGNRFMLTAYEWQNPYPKKIIKNITLKSRFYQKTSIALFALTAQNNTYANATKWDNCFVKREKTCPSKNIKNTPLKSPATKRQAPYNFLWENFSDKSIGAVMKRWKLACSGNIVGQVKSRLFTKKGTKYLSLIVPGGIKKDMKRVIIDRKIDSNVKLAGKFLSLSIYIEGKNQVSLGLYFGDSGKSVPFGNYGVTYKTLQPGMNKIKIAIDQIGSEGAKVKIKNIKMLRISFWLQNADEVKLNISNIRWLDGNQGISYNSNSWYKSKHE